MEMSQQQMKTMKKQTAKNFEDGLNVLRKEYVEEFKEEDAKSTASNKTTQSQKDHPDYISKRKRHFILEKFTATQLRAMHTPKGKKATGRNKEEVAYSALNLVKTKQDLVDFILSAMPGVDTELDESDNEQAE